MSKVVTTLEGDVVKVSAIGRAVVAKRVAIVTAVTILVQLAVNYGWFSLDVSNNVLHYTNAIIDALAGIVAIGVVHPVVTPTKDPRNDVGTALIPVSQVEALIANAVTEAKGESVSDAPAADVPAAEAESQPEAAEAPVADATPPDASAITVDDSDDETVVEAGTLVLPPTVTQA